MIDQRVETLRDEQAVYEMLASVYLELPTEEGVRALLTAHLPEAPAGSSAAALAQFVAENRDRDAAEVLTDIARERVAFVRGGTMKEIKPPYESLYADAKQNEMMGSLNRFYAECGFRKTDEVKDTPDQLGVEYAFLAALVAREIAALEAGDAARADELDGLINSFRSQHVSRWAPRYAEALFAEAETSYWRAVALTILEAEELRP